MAQVVLFPSLAPACEGTLKINVAAFSYEQFPEDLPRQSAGGWVQDPPADHFFRTSPWSRDYSLYGPPCPKQAQVKFTLEKLHVEDSRDVDGSEHLCPDWLCGVDRTQEAYGGLSFAIKRGDGTTQLAATVRLYERSITNGEYPFARERLHICTLAQGVTPERWNCSDYPETRAEPAIWLYVEEGDTVLATVNLKDSDTSTLDDVWCNASKDLGPYTARGWGSIDAPISLWNGGSDQDATCIVEIDAVGLGTVGGIRNP